MVLSRSSTYLVLQNLLESLGSCHSTSCHHQGPSILPCYTRASACWGLWLTQTVPNTSAQYMLIARLNTCKAQLNAEFTKPKTSRDVSKSSLPKHKPMGLYAKVSWAVTFPEIHWGAQYDFFCSATICFIWWNMCSRHWQLQLSLNNPTTIHETCTCLAHAGAHPIQLPDSLAH